MGGYSELLKYCKRIGLLYLCWLIIDFWYVWTNKTYFHVGIGEGIIEFIKDLFFASTFPGSWYLSASVMGGIWVYILNKIFHPVITFVVSYLWLVIFLESICYQIPFKLHMNGTQ